MPLTREQKQRLATALEFTARDRDVLASGRSNAEEAEALRDDAKAYRDLIEVVKQL